jgi:hypothetical protein
VQRKEIDGQMNRGNAGQYIFRENGSGMEAGDQEIA